MGNRVSSPREITVAERVEHYEIGKGKLFLLPTAVKSVVSFRGSLATKPDVARGDGLIQNITTALLDKGTRTRDRFAIAALLDNRGVQFRFTSDDLRVEFSGRALREDIPEVMQIVAEQLREPLFDEAEFNKEKTRMAADLRHAMESTASQASGLLRRKLYSPAHPNFTPDPSRELERLADVTLADVKSYHDKHFGSDEFYVVMVGDVESARLPTQMENCFGDWPPHGAPAVFEEGSIYQSGGRTSLEMADRKNLDVRFGHGLPIRRDDDDFLKLYLANYILGGNFSARLMTTIRDEMGLTYGISSSLIDIDVLHEGHWQVGVTLSQEALEQGIDATMQELTRFADMGVTAAEVKEKKTTVSGTYKVGLATTGGLASAILTNVERGFGPEYLDQFPILVDDLQLDEINGAIDRYLHPGHMHLAVAGTLPSPADRAV